MELSSVLTPITQDAPAGFDIREHADFSEQYFTLRDLRNRIRAEERQVVQLEDLQGLTAEWKPVRDECLVVLSQCSKDVEVLAWLIEASIRLEGFQGLAQSLALADQLIREYWGEMYPRPDEDGIQATLYPLSGLNGDNGEGTLIMPIRMSPFMYSNEQEPVLVWDYIKACELAQIQDQEKLKRRTDNGEQTIAQLQKLVHGNDLAAIRATADAVYAAKESFISLESFLNDMCGFDAPPTSAIKNTLSVAQEALKVIAHIEARSVDPEDIPESEEVEESDRVESKPITRVGAIDPASYYPASREEALVMTSRLSLFFENTEPHSPLSHQMKRVERWGRMSLAELMEELLDDDNARQQFFRLIGLNPNTGS
ncbi:type VI secretion system protein TssA [Marinomonas rhizomae]|uniref:type VI secretion system protein TssA n=1 Tax=Marinomonas rhizomae TaxID=491948 RepID=UPI002102F3CC|nr:type VI secretion system protein TssA [Marinomonas rhizomae]UTV99820.1 type VI secretion system protein TssA [Marinomonas rhizomae]